MAISGGASAKGKYIGICGQGPSDHPDLADWLMAQGIESVSLNPDTVVDTWLRLAKIKASLSGDGSGDALVRRPDRRKRWPTTGSGGS